MSVGILLISHNGIGETMLATAVKILGENPLSTAVLGVSFSADTDVVQAEIEEHINQLDSGDGVLIMTDLYGATPSNVAHRLSERGDIKIVNGINLPMLIRVLNHHNLGLAELSDTAINGGKEGILCNKRNRG